jgi:hypothetical protein
LHQNPQLDDNRVVQSFLLYILFVPFPVSEPFLLQWQAIHSESTQ